MSTATGPFILACFSFALLFIIVYKNDKTRMQLNLLFPEALMLAEVMPSCLNLVVFLAVMMFMLKYW